ncbi:transmembrane protein [Endozoicomonas montiporae CL-33]|nr:transmembrane protein [Endozoicomonas montiporae CL-33]
MKIMSLLKRFILLMWLFSLPIPSVAIEEQRLKAAITFKLTLFVSWPAKEKVLNLCTFSKYSFKSLKSTISHQISKGREIQVKLLGLDEDYSERCQILNLDNLSGSQITDILESIKKQPILTVGSGDSFAREGGMIGLYIDNNNVKFSINLHASRQAELNISSSLLKLAAKVY